MLVRLSSDRRLEKWLVVKLTLLCFPPFPFREVFQHPCPRNGGRYPCKHCHAFFSSPLAPSCPPSLPGAKAALRPPANHGPGVEQIGPGVSIAPGGRKAWHQKKKDKIAGHAGRPARQP
jgi:hypothetical protein